MSETPLIAIHEFSTGIQIEWTEDGNWVSKGFTGQYMNRTSKTIPPAIEQAIENKAFAVAEGSVDDVPTIIGRVVLDSSQAWSVVAVVTRGRDDQNRKLAVYRFFFTEGEGSLPTILTWLKQQQHENQPIIFDPLNSKAVNEPNYVQESTRLTLPEFMPVRPQLPVLDPNQHYSLDLIHALAAKGATDRNPIAWAYQVSALEKPSLFQVIYPTSPQAAQLIQRSLMHPEASSAPINEESIKNAIKSLMTSAEIQRESAETLVSGIKSIETVFKDKKQIKPYWQTIFYGQGAANALERGIYTASMIHLLTLQALILPDTIVQYLKWISAAQDSKLSEIHAIALSFQDRFQAALSQPSVLVLESLQQQGINEGLEAVFRQELEPDQVIWLWKSSSKFWGRSQIAQFVDMLRLDLTRVRHRKRQSLIEEPFNCNSLTWNTIRSGFLSNHNESIGHSKLANVFEKLGYSAISACFYQAGQGFVPSKVYQAAERAPDFNGGNPFGIQVKRQRTWLDVVEPWKFYILGGVVAIAGISLATYIYLTRSTHPSQPTDPSPTVPRR
jgi:hypothetical protein